MAGEMLFNSMTQASLVPVKPLCPGDFISVVAPSSPFDREEFLKALRFFESRSYRLKLGKCLFERDAYLAGPDSARSGDLIEAVTDPETAAVVCVRGGYGSARILDWTPFSAFRGKPKLFLGYSDITFLHAAFHSLLNWPTFHGPNLVDFCSKMEEREQERVLEALEGKRAFSWSLEEHQVLRHGTACGRIVGGNLTCFTHLLGSRYFPDPSGAILLLEDRGESPYRLDRAIAHLKLAGVFERIAGLLLGSFENCGPKDEVLLRIMEHLHPYRFPVIFDLPFGHGSRNDVIPLGVPFILDTRAAALECMNSPFRPSSVGMATAPGLRNSTSQGEGGSAPLALLSHETPDPLERLLQEALKNRTFSCASLLVADSTRILYHRTWGKCQYGGEMCHDKTLFDLASLTKPLLVAPMMMRAVGLGVVDLEEPLTSFFPPSLLGPGHRDITVHQLLNHSSGLPSYAAYYRDLIGKPAHRRKEAILSEILKIPLESRPGEISRYSDLGFILLGILVEEVFETPLETLGKALFASCDAALCGGKSRDIADLDTLLERLQAGRISVFDLPGAGYRPLDVPTDPTAPPLRSREAPFSYAATELCPWRQRLLEGEVQDENAYCLNGVAGHAGLFASARHVWTLIASLWSVFRGRKGANGWTPEVVNLFWTRSNKPSGTTWALGYDTPSPDFSSAGSRFSPRSLGHLGFTGTSFWLDPDAERLVIFLSNRVHPSRENGRIRVFRPVLHNTVMEIFHEG